MVQFTSRRVPCPECGARRGLSVAVNGFGHCHACGYIRKTDDFSYEDARQDGEDDFSPRNKSMLGLIPQTSVKFLSIPDRGINAKTAKKYRYGVSNYKGRHCHVAQWSDDSGTVVAQKLRYTDGQEPKFSVLGDNSKVGLFGLDTVRDGDAYRSDFGSKVIITEGELDALAVCEAMESDFWPAISVPHGATTASKHIRAALEELEKFDQVILCFDEDDAGRAAVKECLPLFSPGKAKVTRLPRKDACEMLQAGDKAGLKKAIYNAKQHRPEGLVSGDAIWEAVENVQSLEGDPYPWEGLNNALRGLRPKELILLTAATGSGKSTISRTLCAHYLERGHTVGYVALEESVRQSALGIYGIPVGWSQAMRGDVPLDKIKEVHERVGHRLHLFDHFGSTATDTLISKLRFLVKGLECDLLFLDHISIAISGLALEDERKALDKMMTDLRSLVEETGCTLVVISHLRRPKEGSHEEGKAVKIADLRGSQSLGQLPDIIIAAERNTQAEDPAQRNTVRLRVLKNRPIGDTGVHAALRYDSPTGLFTEVEVGEPKAVGQEDF